VGGIQYIAIAEMYNVSLSRITQQKNGINMARCCVNGFRITAALAKSVTELPF
jgi:hypothetical protein